MSLPQQAAARVETGGAPTAPLGSRRALFDEHRAQDAAVYRGDAICVGDVIIGPAIVEEATTTLVLPPGTRARLMPSGSYLVDIDL